MIETGNKNFKKRGSSVDMLADLKTSVNAYRVVRSRDSSIVSIKTPSGQAESSPDAPQQRFNTSMGSSVEEVTNGFRK